VLPLEKITSNHILCSVVISTSIPKANIFLFENYWVEQGDFLETVMDCWHSTLGQTDAAKNITAKFKALKAALKVWSRNLSNLRLLISHCNNVINFHDTLEDRRSLFNPETNLRNIIKKQL
jgi:hypothetical protein